MRCFSAFCNNLDKEIKSLYKEAFFVDKFERLDFKGQNRNMHAYHLDKPLQSVHRLFCSPELI